MAHTLLIAGATGSVGANVLRIALKDPRFGRVITWGRRPALEGSGTVEHWGPVNDDIIAGLRPDHVDAVICCLGTTIKAVNGDKQAFIHVDHDLVVALGRWASGKNVRFCVVSAVGADADSRIFYNQVKGSMEQGLRGFDFPALHIFQPSILDGPRKENRPGERFGLAVMRLIAPILPTRLRPMPVDLLARALVATATSPDTGTYVHTYSGIMALAG